VSLTVDLQLDTVVPRLPNRQQVQLWAQAALVELSDNVELVVRVAGAEECRQANSKFRGIDRATNVLSFPSELPAPLACQLDPRPLGDLLLCAPVVLAEARSQGKSAAAHFAHMVVHGVLHLIGHDHQDNAEARRMEGLEVEILKALGYPNPYQSV
jgi:probable rRNA maturation factor